MTEINSNTKIKSWYSNRYQVVVVQRNILLIFTILSIISVSVAVVFVKSIMSSKSLEPYVIQIESKSGVATVVQQLSSENFTGNQMMQKYFINRFVQVASGYEPKTYRQDSDEVRILSTRNIYADYKKRINPWELGANSKISVRIKSILFKNNNSAQVRLSKQIVKEDQSFEEKNEIIEIIFYFAPEVDLPMEERMINPLGFQVSKYEIAEELYSY